MAISDLFLLAVISSVPIQLGKIFWPDFAFVLGIPIDYLAIIFYLTDFIILGYIFFFMIEHFSFRNFKYIKEQSRRLKYFLFILLLLNFYLLFSALFISNSSLLPLWLSMR